MKCVISLCDWLRVDGKNVRGSNHILVNSLVYIDAVELIDVFIVMVYS